MKVAFTEEEKQALCRMQHLSTFKWLDASNVKKYMPQVTDHMLGAGLIEEDVHVEPYAVCRALWQAAVRYGADGKDGPPSRTPLYVSIVISFREIMGSLLSVQR